ncbi:hypothetical protein OPQ81_003260 [Rhizoctonia solani]|nr:hypothetical protein OPQ81_003260 [Rhizoctonia solani]
MTVQLITAKLVDLSDPQRTRFQPRQYRSKPGSEARPNLALLIAGEYDCAGIPDASQRPFIRLCHGKIRYLKTFQQILDSLQSPSRQPSLWVRNDLETVRDHVRKLLDTIADSTIGLATEGTGELTIDSLFWGDTHIKDLPPEWEDPIAKQVSALLDVYVDKMWSTFSEALKQINEANQNGQSEQSITRSRRSMALQRVRTSPLVLGTRLTPLGLRAAWNAARVRASLDLDESPLMPLIRMMRTMRDVPNQILNVSTIARDFLAVLAMKREGVRDEIRRARGNGEQVQASTTPNLSLDLGRSTVLGMMSDIDLRRPELEDQVVCELEKAIKKLALRRPKCSMYQLRRATLEMLIRLKETGKSINFGLQQESTWRICLWYSLGEEIVKVLEEAAESISNKRIHCWLRTSESEIRGEERPMLISDIHDFIRGRIKDLSVMLHNQGGPGATEYCRKEIEEAMDNIWKRMLEEDKRTETQINRKDRH